MKNKHCLPALCAGFFMSAAHLHAAVRTLPTPPPSGFVDAESSVVVALADWRDYTPQAKLTLELNGSATNAVQMAFGKDRNGDADLQPEETEYIVGYDCGEWFTRDERHGGAAQSDADQPSSPGRASHTFALLLAKIPADRWDLAKITTRGGGDSQAQVSATLVKPHFYIVIR